jgi:predicted ABC-type ATPase
MSMQYPHLIVIAGPNGAGKSTLEAGNQDYLLMAKKKKVYL